MPVSPQIIPRYQAIRVAGEAVGFWYSGLSFDHICVHGPDEGGTVAGAEPSSFALCLGLLAEARGRHCGLKVIARRYPDDWTRIDSQTVDTAKEALNAPKMWAAINGVAGALQARRRLDRNEVAAVVERIMEGAVLPAQGPRP